MKAVLLELFIVSLKLVKVKNIYIATAQQQTDNLGHLLLFKCFCRRKCLKIKIFFFLVIWGQNQPHYTFINLIPVFMLFRWLSFKDMVSQVSTERQVPNDSFLANLSASHLHGNNLFCVHSLIARRNFGCCNWCSTFDTVHFHSLSHSCDEVESVLDVWKWTAALYWDLEATR